MTAQTRALALGRVQAQQSVRAAPYDFLSKSGAVIETEMSVDRMMDGQGQHLKSIAVMHDVTDRNQSMRRRDKMLNALEASNQELVTLTSVIAGDLHDPLKHFERLLVSIEQSLPNGESSLKNYFSMAGQSIQQMQGLVVGILSLLSLESTPRAEQDENLLQLLTQLQQLPELLALTDASLEMLSPLPSVRVTSDCLGEVFGELLINAIKFRNPEVPLCIKVSAAPAAASKDYWEVIISDNGLGFPAELCSQVFEPLSRFHVSRHPTGLGLGLARATRLLRQMRGTISVVSQAGGGASFTIRFPRIIPASES